MLEKTIVVSGVGGQGVVTLARIIGHAAFIEGYKVTICETHGLSHRMGSVFAIVRYGLEDLSPVIKSSSADILVSLDLVESLRYSYMIRKNGVIISSDIVSWFYNKDLAEVKEEALRKLSSIEDIVKIMVKTSRCRPLNTFMLGALLKTQDLGISREAVITALSKLFRYEVLKRNLLVFKKGLEAEVVKL